MKPLPHPARSRRTFLQQSLAAGAIVSVAGFPGRTPAADVPPATPASGKEPDAPSHRMKICLSTGMIGVNANFKERIRLALQHGFTAVDPAVDEWASLPESALTELRDELKQAGLTLGAAGMGVPVKQPDAEFDKWLQQLKPRAAALAKMGGNRMVTWIGSGDNQLTYLQNFKLHARRIAAIADVVADHGIRFGLEYIGPKTSWSRARYPFIHTMAEMKELIAETSKQNLGFLLDSWHWYTAGETAADLLSLRAEQVIYVHVNDAPAGIAVDQQIDSRRALPAATGVIDIGAFLGALKQLGYDGPVAAEPFDVELRKLPAQEAVKRTMTGLQQAFARMK